MDPELLPELPLIDTGVLIRGLGERPNDKDAPDCVEFFKAMREKQRDILIAAPTIAEFLRFRKGKPPPPMEGLVVVAFDHDAASILGQRFPEELLNDWPKKTSNPLHYYKYDALIVASAVRWRATCIVALDAGLRALADQQNLRSELPQAFRSKQGRLALVQPTSPLSARGHGSTAGDT